MTTEASQLVLIRQLAEEAERQLVRDDDFGHGLAVSLMQDAVELLIRVTVRTHNIEVPARATWDQMADAISKAAANDQGKVPHRARLEDLNKARVAFKHSGTSTSKADAHRLVRFGLEFLEAAAPRLVGIEYTKISLTSTVRNDDVRKCLQQAEAMLEEERWRDATAEAAEAFQRSGTTLRRLLPEASSIGKHEKLGTLAPYLDRLRSLTIGALVNIDPIELLNFQASTPSILRSIKGERQAIFTGIQPSQESAGLAVQFATRFALAVERRFGDGA